jgi:DNA (cytosine-5)-methyltransferase 1
MAEAINTISLFSGCGGMDLGFILSGYNIIWANDIDHDACITYRNNLGDHIVESDIINIDLQNIPDCDLILGGFPCQDFSVIWKRKGLSSERGNLYKYFVKAVQFKNPKIFVAENVRGLMTANQGKAIEQIKTDFEACGNFGYNLNVDIYNFADYGVPQLRERVLIIGIRKDLDFEYIKPFPTHRSDNYITSGEALKGVEKVPFNNEHQNIKKKTVEMLKLIPEGDNFTAIPKDSPYYVKGMISHVYRRLNRNKPSTTIIAAGGGGTWGYHYSEPRPLTNRERARLFGYPDSFVFHGSIASVRKQIGNSVPPPATKIIGDSLKKAFASKQDLGLIRKTKVYSQLSLPIIVESSQNKDNGASDLNSSSFPSKVLTATNIIAQKYNSVSTLRDPSTEILDVENNLFLTKEQALEYFSLVNREIDEKDLDFRRKASFTEESQIPPEIETSKVRGGGNRILFEVSVLQNYLLNLELKSIDLIYQDAKIVVQEYDSVLSKARKYGMRGQRNFTGKVEDEIRGKLAEHSFSKFLENLTGIVFPVDYSLLNENLPEDSTYQKRDAGDFTQVVINNNFINLPKNLTISLKSTNGNFLAIPEDEMEWEGNWYFLVKLHIKETFLYKAIKAGLELETLNLKERLGWLEIRGYVSKSELLDSYRSIYLPTTSKTLKNRTELSKPNLIKAPVQLQKNLDFFKAHFQAISQ